MQLYQDIKQLVSRHNGSLYWVGKSLPEPNDKKPAIQFKTSNLKEWKNAQQLDVCEERFKLIFWESYPTGYEGFENACEQSKNEITAGKKILRRIIAILTEHYGYERITGEGGAFSITEIDYPVTSNCMIGVSIEGPLRICKSPECCEETDFDLLGIAKVLPNWKTRQ